MCGICGLIVPKADSAEGPLRALVDRMTLPLAHRGPDDAGTWAEPACGVALGHRRLSVLDLSAEGHQPMVSASGRYVLAYNGEVYNHLALRAELEGGHPFRGHSDTETLLAGFEAWGVRRTVERANGMFALAVWDRQDRDLLLVRDRMGIKPLYYGYVGADLVFASQLCAARAHPAFAGAIDRGALALYLRHSCIPAPHCIYRDWRKLPPGTMLRLPLRAMASRAFPEPTPYWSLRDVFREGAQAPFTGTPDEAVDRLHDRLGDAVSMRRLSDVPLGAFLSGGVDSTAVVALLQAKASKPVKTFTIGFQDAEYDESAHARRVAEHLGTDHTELQLSPQQAQQTVPRLPGVYDEPFADSSQLPTVLVSELARRSVTVSLSGDGGDELFCGYTRFSLLERMWQWRARVPASLRSAAVRSASALPGGLWRGVWAIAGPLFPRALRQKDPAHLLHKLRLASNAGDPQQLYRLIVSHAHDPAKLLGAVTEPETVLTSPSSALGEAALPRRAMYWDAAQYLPEDILTKVDRASMSVALEARVPILDHRVVSLAASFPLSLQRRDGRGKWPLRQVAYRYVPAEILDRPKMGFGVPVGGWIRGPLRDWAEGLLDERRLREDGLLDPSGVRTLWRQHLDGTIPWTAELWDLLMLQAWLREYH
jgi:asparagine synthase (glutamine-hydrolysing)